MAGHGGGSWKVAYADFVTAMMAFFLVMWITAQNNAVKRAIAHYFQDPLSNSNRPSGGPPLLPSNKDGQTSGPSIIASKKTGSSIGVDTKRGGWFTRQKSGNKEGDNSEKKDPIELVAKKPSLFMIHNGSRRYMGTMVLFKDGSTELDDKAKERLLILIDELRGKLQKIEIRGHAKSNFHGEKDKSNDPWHLSYARCQAVLKFLVQNGIEPERIRLSQGGAYEPYSLEVDPSQQIYNSRVEVFVLDEYAEDLMGTPEEREKRFVKPTKD
ncbi:MAG: OmpA/MotB family protein [Thermoguttaceae bacterium]